MRNVSVSDLHGQKHFFGQGCKVLVLLSEIKTIMVGSFLLSAFIISSRIRQRQFTHELIIQRQEGLCALDDVASSFMTFTSRRDLVEAVFCGFS